MLRHLSCVLVLSVSGCDTDSQRRPPGGGASVHTCAPEVEKNDRGGAGYRAFIPVAVINNNGPRLISSLVLEMDVALEVLGESDLIKHRMDPAGAGLVRDHARMIRACVVGPVFSEDVSVQVAMSTMTETQTRLQEGRVAAMATRLQNILRVEVLVVGAARVVDGVVTNHPNLREFVEFGPQVGDVRVLKYDVGDASGFNGFSFSLVVGDATLVPLTTAGVTRGQQTE